MAKVLVYQKGLNGNDAVPFAAELLETRHQRLRLRWKMKDGYFIEGWVNAGCCSTVTGRVRPKLAVEMQSIRRKPKLQL